jgi:hypothetical protein
MKIKLKPLALATLSWELKQCWELRVQEQFVEVLLKSDFAWYNIKIINYGIVVLYFTFPSLFSSAQDGSVSPASSFNLMHSVYSHLPNQNNLQEHPPRNSQAIHQ